ncbi:MAG TPA: hypothetical protein VIM11_26975 [Tepidisphaeraceae bacterium]
MPTLGQVINALLLAVIAIATWLLPRRLGLGGMFAAQALSAGGFVLMGYVALQTGLWDVYDGPETIVGLLIESLVFNILLLPVAMFALWRRRKHSPSTTVTPETRGPRSV